MLTRHSFAFATLTLLATAGCDNPAKDKPQATVAEPITTAASTAATAPAAASAGAAASAPAYAITPENSKVEWTGSKVTGSHDGNFEKFGGAITYAGAVEKSTVTIDVDTTSLKVAPDMLMTHLKSPDFFDVQKYPQASFTSTSITGTGGDGYTVAGNLDLHGVKKSITFPATITASAPAVDAKATFSINRKDFGINYAGKANDLIRDEVVMKLTIHATRKL